MSELLLTPEERNAVFQNRIFNGQDELYEVLCQAQLDAVLHPEWEDKPDRTAKYWWFSIETDDPEHPYGEPEPIKVQLMVGFNVDVAGVLKAWLPIKREFVELSVYPKGKWTKALVPEVKEGE